MVAAPVGEAMDEPRIAVVRKDDRAACREEGVELRVGEAVRVLALGLEAHGIDDVDDTYLELGQVLTEQLDCSEGLECRTSPQQAITTSGSDSSSLLAHSQMPRPLVQWITASSMESQSAVAASRRRSTFT